MMQLEVEKYIKLLDGKDPKWGLEALVNEFKGKITFSTSFGVEDQVITHFISKNNLDVKIFTLDTGRLFQETYEVFQKTKELYNIQIFPYSPDRNKIENLLAKKGPNSFYSSVENRKECCFIRKVEPLNRALEGMQCWITGIRGDQSENRQNLKIVEFDEQRKILKYQPLLHWTSEQVWDFVKKNSIPYNSLHDSGFPSIGCAPCTRAIEPGEDERAGRWWWEIESKKECGLHWENGKLVKG